MSTTDDPVAWATSWRRLQLVLFGEGVFLAAVQAGPAAAVFATMSLYCS